MHLDKFQALAIHLRKIADECKSSGRDYCTVDAKVLIITSAAIDELLLKIAAERGISPNSKN